MSQDIRKFAQQHVAALAEPINDLVGRVIEKGLTGILEECCVLQRRVTELEAQQEKDAARLEIKVWCGGDQPSDVFVFEINGKITIPHLQDMEEALQEDIAENNGTFHGCGEYTFMATYNEAEKSECGRIEVDAYWDFTEIAFKAEPAIDAALSAQANQNQGEKA